MLVQLARCNNCLFWVMRLTFFGICWKNKNIFCVLKGLGKESQGSVESFSDFGRRHQNSSQASPLNKNKLCQSISGDPHFNKRKPHKQLEFYII